jgi:hypothetical protein
MNQLAHVIVFLKTVNLAHDVCLAARIAQIKTKNYGLI